MEQRLTSRTLAAGPCGQPGGANVPVTIDNLGEFIEVRHGGHGRLGTAHTLATLTRTASGWARRDMQRVVAVTLVEGVRAQMEALRAGFAGIVALADLKPFSVAELDTLFNGVEEAWDTDGA